MHHRNIYKTPPDFSKLATKYPEFLKISKIDLNGTVRIDFKDKNSLRILTKCLLHSDFGLDVDVPTHKLIPTVPLRLNYLLWLEDICENLNNRKEVIGIDIGTGASCIYPLLAAKKFQWKMIGTEVDKESVIYAKKNVSQNNLDSFITVKSTSHQDNLLIGQFDDTDGVDFCMCNPPFYSSLDELNNARSPSRTSPNNAHTGSMNEIVTLGGEENFVRKIIDESIILRNKIKVYTTMLGHKKLLKPLIGYIKSHGIKQITHTTFVQGKTARWGLAWSFIDSINLCDQKNSQKNKTHKPLSFVIPAIEGVDYNVAVISEKIFDLLDVLNIKYIIANKTENDVLLDIEANQNTWSHQRRKKRQMKQNLDIDKNKNNVANPHKRQSEDIDNSIDESKGQKRPKIEGNDINEFVDTKTSNNNVSLVCTTEDSMENKEKPSTSTFLRGALCVKKEEDVLILEVAYINGSAGKDAIHQIIQYIKNNWR